MINKVKYIATDAAIVVATFGAIGLVGWFVARSISSLDKITIDKDPDSDESWWD